VLSGLAGETNILGAARAEKLTEQTFGRQEPELLCSYRSAFLVRRIFPPNRKER
jgi:hypothetical protein